jgi:hypothetical protein
MGAASGTTLQKAIKELFLHGIDCMRADSLEERPEVPQIYLVICDEAKDPAAVLEDLTSAGFVEIPYDTEALLSERRLLPVHDGSVEQLYE